MSTSHTTAFIVDDDPAIRDALTLMLEQENMVVKAFESAEAFLNSYQPDCKGCAIIDIRMPGMDGMALHQVLLTRNIALPVIFLTGHGDIPMSVQAMKAGAVDFLTKPVTREKLLASVKAAIELSETMLSHHTSHQNAVSKLSTLTERERDVMQLAVLGHTNKHIARELGISHRTVEIHKSKIMHKTGAQNLLDLVRIAHESE
ncbi:MAG TPA: response regulator [Methylotenera sp.]|nr:response regulator [Methylotenera sp.]HPH05375.1 response regulator [Methylotenera sp.]HPN01301.1 response regulator [Methylotenera sp.]